MPSLKEVRNRIVSVKSTQQITKAMKMVSAAKMRKAQDRIVQLRPYANKLEGILQSVSQSVENEVPNEYAIEREIRRVLIVVVTSDRGLCGPFNANVTKAVIGLLTEKYAEQQQNGQVELLCVGSKGRDFMKRRGYNVNSEFVSLFTQLSFDTARGASEYAMNGFLKGQFDAVELVYNEFKNVATQIVRVSQFLPILKTPVTAGKSSVEKSEYIFEPEKTQIVADLIPYSLKIKFYRAILESNAAEHGARMTAMDKATDNAAELLKSLTLMYNRSRQAAITKEILEIVGGANALADQ